MKRAIKYFLNDLPEPAKSQARKNACNDTETVVSNLNEALSNAFTWEFSPEGHKYWSDIAHSKN